MRFKHGGGRVRQARVDVAESLQIEQAGRVLGRIEHVGSGLIQRHRAAAGGGVRHLPGVQGEGFESVVAVSHLQSGSAGQCDCVTMNASGLAVRVR